MSTENDIIRRLSRRGPYHAGWRGLHYCYRSGYCCVIFGLQMGVSVWYIVGEMTQLVKSKTIRRCAVRQWWCARRWAIQQAIILASGMTIHQYQAMLGRRGGAAGKGTTKRQPPRAYVPRHTCTPARMRKYTAPCRKCVVEEQQALQSASPPTRSSL